MILCIIQARMSSTRLPGKVLMPIAGKPILQWVIDAARNSKLVDTVVVATSTEPEDDQIADYASTKYVLFHLGKLNDVLDRFYRVALEHKPTHIVRLTADCPMLDSRIIDRTIQCHLMGNYDYTHNVGFPDGLDVEIFTMQALTRAAKLATEEYDREHVTSFMRNEMLFKVGEYRKLEIKNITKEYRLEKYSVDTPEDYERIKEEAECLLSQKGCSNRP